MLLLVQGHNIWLDWDQVGIALGAMALDELKKVLKGYKVKVEKLMWDDFFFFFFLRHNVRWISVIVPGLILRYYTKSKSHLAIRLQDWESNCTIQLLKTTIVPCNHTTLFTNFFTFLTFIFNFFLNIFYLIIKIKNYFLQLLISTAHYYCIRCIRASKYCPDLNPGLQLMGKLLYTPGVP